MENNMDFEEAVKQLSKQLGTVKVSDYLTACFNADELDKLAPIHLRFNELYKEIKTQNHSLAAIKFVQLYNDICKIESRFELTEIDDKSIPNWITENLERIEKQIHTNEKDNKSKKILDWEQIGEEMSTTILTTLKKEFRLIRKYRK